MSECSELARAVEELVILANKLDSRHYNSEEPEHARAYKDAYALIMERAIELQDLIILRGKPK